MEMIDVESSNLDSIGYDEPTREMNIAFNDGSLYAYYNVPPDIWNGFQNASSAGQYFHQNIKGKYEHYR